MAIIDEFWWVWLLGFVLGFCLGGHGALSFDNSSHAAKYTVLGFAIAWISAVLLLASTIINVAQYIIGK